MKIKNYESQRDAGLASAKLTKEYKPSEIESKWQKVWEKNKTYEPKGLQTSFDSAQDLRPFYNLMMFPYPSAEGLHVGNMYAFTGSDLYGRFKRMQGYDVFEPIGLDGFGIHSENYAIKVGKHPKEQAKVSEANFYRQLASIGNGFAWDHKLETYDPEYYKWTQWVFIQLFKAGLAYRKKAPVNFCPSCKTVLADEQVLRQVQSSKFKVQSRNEMLALPVQSKEQEVQEVGVGICERCSSVVEKRDLEQWFFKITEYADRLLDNLDKIDWSQKVKIAQKQWIGRSEGAKIRFMVDSSSLIVEPGVDTMNNEPLTINVYTVYPETIYGVTFLVLAPEHDLVQEILKSNLSLARLVLARLKKVRDYVESTKKKSDQDRMAVDKEKTGVFSGLYAINPLTGKKIPIWIADYVLAGYGTGAVMGVPGSDHRDFVFAKKYDLPVVQVIAKAPNQIVEIKDLDQVLEEGYLVNSGPFTNLKTPDVAREKVKDFLEEKKYGKRINQYHLRDWLISRQRYWGPPIPMIFCSTCASQSKSYFSTQSGELPILASDEVKNETKETQETKVSTSVSSVPAQRVSFDPSAMVGWFPDENLPVLLPDVADWKPLGSGSSPLASHPEFFEVKCPHCGADARRETDVSDTFLDSSWYFLRYLATDLKEVPFPSPAFINSKLEIRNSKQIQNSNDKNSKGSRISTGKASISLRFGDFDIRVSQERMKFFPVAMYIGGAEHSVLHLLYSRFVTMVFKDLGFINFEEPFTRFYAHGLIIKDGAKMSKSKGNVIVPDTYIAKYGADTVRSYLMFTGPYNMGGDFRDSGVEGMNRFLKRVWMLITESGIKNNELRENANEAELDRLMHQTIKKVTQDLENLRYNVALAGIMTYYNGLITHNSKFIIHNSKYFKTLVLLLAPFAPHMTEELFQLLNSKSETRNSKFDSVHTHPWPTYNESLLQSDSAVYAVQINGKLRDTLEIGSSTLEQEVVKKAKGLANIAKFLSGKSIKKEVFVVGKIVNFVIEQ